MSVPSMEALTAGNARIDGTDVVQQHFYDIGVAVSTEKGLMVPVVRDADQRSFADIEKQIGELAKRARDGKIGVTDLEGGTFTITNGGIFGSMMDLALSYDHRIIDGREAVSFLVRVKECLESPERLLLEV